MRNTLGVSRNFGPPSGHAVVFDGRTWAEAVAEAIGRYPEHESWIRTYDERWIETIGGIDHDVVALVRELRGRGVPVYALTNYSAEKWGLSRDHVDAGSLRSQLVGRGLLEGASVNPRSVDDRPDV